MKVKIICGCADRLKRHDHRQMFHHVFPEIFRLDDRSKIDYVNELVDKGEDVNIITNSVVIFNKFRVHRSVGTVKEMEVVFLPYESEDILSQKVDNNGSLEEWYGGMFDATRILLSELFKCRK